MNSASDMNGDCGVRACGNGSNRKNVGCGIGVGVGVQFDEYSVSGSNSSNRINDARDVGVGGNASCIIANYKHSSGNNIYNNNGNAINICFGGENKTTEYDHDVEKCWDAVGRMKFVFKSEQTKRKYPRSIIKAIKLWHKIHHLILNYYKYIIVMFVLLHHVNVKQDVRHVVTLWVNQSLQSQQKHQKK